MGILGFTCCSGSKENEPNAVLEKEKEKLEADGDSDENGKSRIGKYLFISGLLVLGVFFIIMSQLDKGPEPEISLGYVQSKFGQLYGVMSDMTGVLEEVENEKVQIPAGVLPNFSGEYMIRMFYTDPTYFKNWQYNDVTLATQCSANHLHHVVMLTERWSGPISVGVFAPNLDASFATDAILSMQECWPEMTQRVTFHLVYPTQHKADLSNSIGYIEHSDCEELRNIIHNYGADDSQNYKGDIPYPHNVLRNAARKGAATEFVFLIDVDVMPSLNMREGFNDFAQRHSLYDQNNNDRAVFVVPVFEILKGHKCPNDKVELKTAVNDKRDVRPFHNATCRWCHEPEAHVMWLQKPKNNLMEISFNATWNKSWEPFYIARRNVPLFDERFKQYGFDRIEQICELHVAGYTFSVLNNAFLVHDGWKEAHAAARLAETFRNWVLFHFHFQQALLKMYHEPQSCAPIEIWIPRGNRMKDDIVSRHAKILRKYASNEI